MAHQKYRGPVARALPAEQEVPVDDGFLQIFVHQREQLLQKLMEAEEFLGLVDIRVRHSFVLYHFRQLVRKLKSVVAGLWRDIVRALVRRKNSVHNGGRRQRQRRGSGDHKYAFFHYHAPAFL